VNSIQVGKDCQLMSGNDNIVFNNIQNQPVDYNCNSMVKLHLFSGFENSRLGITRDMRLGHLYSDSSLQELKEAAKRLGINPEYLQNSRGFYHYDLWGKPLEKACLLFKIVDNHELYRDIRSNRLVSEQEIVCCSDIKEKFVKDYD
jgi:hypothetical protein